VATLTIGRIAMKIAGREAGKYCVVLTNPKDNFVQVTGPKVLTGIKRRRCNVEHLEPTEYQVKIEVEASEKKIIDVLDKEGILKKLGLKKPSPEVVKGPTGKDKKEEKDKKPEKTKKEAPKEEKKEGKTVTISLPRLGKKKETPKTEEKPSKKVEKKVTKPKEKSAKK